MIFKNRSILFKLITNLLIFIISIGVIFITGNFKILNSALGDKTIKGEKSIEFSKDDIELTPQIKIAKIDDMNVINIETNKYFDLLNDGKEGFSIKSENSEISIKNVEIPEKNTEGKSNKAKITLSENIDFKKDYVVFKDNYESAKTIPGKVLTTTAFEDQFTYSKNDLGVSYSKNKTKFRLWAPLAKSSYVVLYKEGIGGNSIKEILMKSSENGTWMVEEKGNLDGTFYTYKVQNGDNFVEAMDPYAKAVGVNGDRGMVTDLSDTNPKGWKNDKSPKLKNQTDAILYELHIRDLSTDTDSGIKNKGKFLGLTEEGTKSPNGEKTGLDHIKDLGVTHIHLLPSFDFASIDETKLTENKFNWGYDPKNYNVPEGSYSTDPYNGDTRINEFKQMVKKFHDNDISVVMDVVYNHTYISQDSHLNKLVPNYYYRQNENGSFSNASGCGNETASERSMVRKMIVDSVKYWVSEYHIDGFRFDLMGIHDITTMNLIRKELNKINPNIIIYGEGWTAGASPLDESLRAVKKNTSQLDNIAAFSDDIRDGIKGHVFTPSKPGFINGLDGLERTIMFGVTASTAHNQMEGHYNEVNYSSAPWAKNPTQTITYYEAHDNLTLWDKLAITNPNSSEKEKIAIQKLAAGITLTSQGISFLHAGSEFLRTKNGNDNSYNSPDNINQLDWSRKSEYKDVYNYFKGLIKLRKSHPAFRIPTTSEVNKDLKFIDGLGDKLVGYTINSHANNDSWNTIAVIYNANTEEKEVTIPGTTKKWGVVVNQKSSGNKIINIINGNKIDIKEKSLIVATDSIK